MFPESLGACWEANCVQGEMPTRRRTATLPFLNHRKNQTSIEQLNKFPGTHRDTNTQSIMTSTTVSSCSVQTRFLGHTNSFEPIYKSLICELHIPMYPIEIFFAKFYIVKRQADGDNTHTHTFRRIYGAIQVWSLGVF